MNAHASPESTIIDSRPMGHPRLTKARAGLTREKPMSQPLLALAVVAALLLGIVGAAWGLRQHGGEDAPIRLAAVVPQGTPTPKPTWSTWIQPEECTLERMSPSEVTRLQAESDFVPMPTYGPVSAPSRVDAEAAASGARTLASCFMYRSDGTYSSESYLWLYTSPNSPLSTPNASHDHQESNGREVSRDLDAIEPSELLVVASQNPTSEQQDLPVTFLPSHAVQFPDGRIGLPMAYLVPNDLAREAPETLYTVLFVLSDESGTWLLDDSLLVCVGDCDAYLDGGSWQGNEFLQAGDADPRDPSVATPIATPEN